ncbi:MinD/ParA family ATP-binding protein [Herbidospora daliensis]|uniref:MinD/ParA family ATP-binding protein n=1 Tax=Herbidospora daliensis TaxID=295585 RepID=UPI000ACE63CE|nr:cellulose synthase operon protein YhjQ/BcsQ [Herbidospora daliensis]
MRRLAASADSAVEPEAPAPSADWQKERLRKGQPPAPFIPAERGSEATWRRVSQVVAGSDGDNDEDRARTTINGSRRIVVLGCTGGAGQTTTTLLLGHSLARLREDGVVAVDANSGGDGLTGRISPETPETLSSFLTAVDGVGTRVRDYTTRSDSGLDVLAADVDPGAEQRIGDRGWFSDQRIARAMRLLDQQYRIILMDPAAALAARLLPYADQLVLVAPASADAPDSVAMTYDWLDGHGCADLRRRAVVVINGVSRRSMADVERAETVARGRCRAIVRVPWEDELAEPGQVDLDDLRSGGRRAYVALAGVVASGLTTARGESFVG